MLYQTISYDHSIPSYILTYLIIPYYTIPYSVYVLFSFHVVEYHVRPRFSFIPLHNVVYISPYFSWPSIIIACVLHILSLQRLSVHSKTGDVAGQKLLMTQTPSTGCERRAGHHRLVPDQRLITQLTPPMVTTFTLNHHLARPIKMLGSSVHSIRR